MRQMKGLHLSNLIFLLRLKYRVKLFINVRKQRCSIIVTNCSLERRSLFYWYICNAMRWVSLNIYLFNTDSFVLFSQFYNSAPGCCFWATMHQTFFFFVTDWKNVLNIFLWFAFYLWLTKIMTMSNEGSKRFNEAIKELRKLYFPTIILLTVIYRPTAATRTQLAFYFLLLFANAPPPPPRMILVLYQTQILPLTSVFRCYQFHSVLVHVSTSWKPIQWHAAWNPSVIIPTHSCPSLWIYYLALIYFYSPSARFHHFSPAGEQRETFSSFPPQSLFLKI